MNPNETETKIYADGTKATGQGLPDQSPAEQGAVDAILATAAGTANGDAPTIEPQPPELAAQESAQQRDERVAANLARTRPNFGDSVLFWPSEGHGQTIVPMAAMITHVWGESCVNLEVPTALDDEGCPVAFVAGTTSVFLWRPGRQRPSGYYCAYVDELADLPPEVAQPLKRPEPITVHPIYHLYLAQQLPEVSSGTPYENGDERVIVSFKDTDERTMRVVLTADGLAKCQVPAQA